MSSLRELGLRVLESGDCMDSDEFMRRYERRPDVNKAELVDGIVYIAGPVGETLHGVPHAILGGWLGFYTAFTANLRAANRGTVILDDRNTVQPDTYLRKLDGGSARLNADGYLMGAPELVMEVAASSASIDAHKKKDAYLRGGVAEYVLYRTVDGELDWWALEDGRFEPIPVVDGFARSRIFPGLILHVAALLAGDTGSVLTTLQNEIAKRSA